MYFHIVTLFPKMFDSYLDESILARAIKQKKISVSFTNPRLFVTGKYKKVWPDGNVSLQVDDRPYAGGPGMVMRAEPVIKAVEKILKKIHPLRPMGTSPLAGGRGMRGKKPKVLVVNFSPSGEKFTTAFAKKFSNTYTDIIMICGRYEGIDARVDKILKTKKFSIGDYVLTGGEIPAMVFIDSISRQVEGTLGNFNSREEERISTSEVYTRPEILIHNKKKYKVPTVLLSGNQKKIEEWKNNSKN